VAVWTAQARAIWWVLVERTLHRTDLSGEPKDGHVPTLQPSGCHVISQQGNIPSENGPPRLDSDWSARPFTPPHPPPSRPAPPRPSLAAAAATPPRALNMAACMASASAAFAGTRVPMPAAGTRARRAAPLRTATVTAAVPVQKEKDDGRSLAGGPPAETDVGKYEARPVHHPRCRSLQSFSSSNTDAADSYRFSITSRLSGTGDGLASTR
jgi:hypothetical protein